MTNYLVKKVKSSEVIVNREKSKKFSIPLQSDEFNSDEEVAILKLNDFLKLNKLASESENKDQTIMDLKREIKSLQNDVKLLNGRIDEEEGFLPESSIKSKLLFELQEKVNQRNQMLFVANDNINQTIEDVILDTVNETSSKVASDNAESKNKLNTVVNKSENVITERNRAIANNINSTVEQINDELQNVSIWKLLFNRKDIDIKVPTEDLNKQVKLNISSDDIIKDEKVDIDLLKIKDSHKLFDLKQLWITTSEDEKEPIDITDYSSNEEKSKKYSSNEDKNNY